MCLNTIVTSRRHGCAEPFIAINSPELSKQPEAVVNASSWPVVQERPARAGGVAERIDNACETQLRLAGGVLSEAALRAAAASALPLLLADGVNANSARKGVGVWVRARKSAA